MEKRIPLGISNRFHPFGLGGGREEKQPLWVQFSPLGSHLGFRRADSSPELVTGRILDPDRGSPGSHTPTPSPLSHPEPPFASAL